ncbi:MAG: 6-hydroxynicotinate reductase [Gammaproteobacteria bacterium]|nr:6-hydroxynicotinate reductase [Gammaproteobacteria bacterium]
MTERFGAREKDNIVRCDACPVLCRIRPERSGACGRYANIGGELARVDPLIILENSSDSDTEVVPFADSSKNWNGSLVQQETFVTAIGAGTTYPDYKPAPFIVSTQYDDVETVTVVSEGIFSYCGVKIKLDTDKHLGAEQANVLCDGEHVGHVTTSEYGSPMLSLGGVNHLTGGSKREGKITCNTIMALCNRQPVELDITNGSSIQIQAGHAPIIDGVTEQQMRVGCGSATIGIFAEQWHGLVDEVIVVDEHITGVLSEHQAGRCLGMEPSGIRVCGRRSTPGRYFNVANSGQGWGGTDITDPFSIIESIDEKIARSGSRLLMTTTTGDESIYCILDENLQPVQTNMPTEVRIVIDRIKENCEPSLCSVLFVAGAGGSLRAGVTGNPVNLTHSVKESLTSVTMGGAPVYVWPGGGITIMVDVTRMPENAFGYVPTPAIVAPIEFTLSKKRYAEMGGHIDYIQSLEDIQNYYGNSAQRHACDPKNPWPLK